MKWPDTFRDYLLLAFAPHTNKMYFCASVAICRLYVTKEASKMAIMHDVVPFISDGVAFVRMIAPGR